MTPEGKEMQSVVYGLGPGQEGFITETLGNKHRKCPCTETLIAVCAGVTSRRVAHRLVYVNGAWTSLGLSAPTGRHKRCSTCAMKAHPAGPGICPQEEGNKNILCCRHFEKSDSGVHA